MSEEWLRDNFDPDELEEKKKWLLISFQGDLANGLLDSEALEVTEFNVKIC
ncbi:hypothetical protein [Clostridium sporogenes]|uniref:hypothetical protein n=1 Tax=Clostridium sporogenes TaxID=1509 RepID=UPI0002F146D5|nr:hypothetical protein [Clostridium sporogenes]MDU4598527.1 hypothetical protein [Clostridium sporogenes]